MDNLPQPIRKDPAEMTAEELCAELDRFDQLLAAAAAGDMDTARALMGVTPEEAAEERRRHDEWVRSLTPEQKAAIEVQVREIDAQRNPAAA